MLKDTGHQAILLEMQEHASPHEFWGSREMVILLLAIISLATILFLWAAYVRKPKRKSISRSLENKKSSSEISISQSHNKNDRRLKRRSRRRRNPTLAETGGLPPHKDRSSFSSLR